MKWTLHDLYDLIAEIQSGGRPKGGASEDTGEMPSLGGENIVQSGGVDVEFVKRVPRSFFNKMTKGKLQADDVLINKDGANTGKLGMYRSQFEAASINEHLFLLRGNTNQITQNYLYYLLLSNFGQATITTKISGSAQPGLKRNFIKDFPVKIPVDRAIEQTEAIIVKYQRVKTGLMQDLLTRGIDENGNFRDPATHKFKDSPLGKIPKDWETARLEDKRIQSRPHLKTGPFGTQLKGEHWVEEGVTVITIGSLGDGIFIDKELLFITHKKAGSLSACAVQSGDLVFSHVADVGRSVVIGISEVGWIMSSNLMRICLDSKKVLPHFLHALIVHSGYIRKQIRQLVNSSGREVANTPILDQLLFAFPSINEQRRICTAISIQDRYVQEERKKLHNFQMLKIGLMQDLLTGNVSVEPLLTPDE